MPELTEPVPDIDGSETGDVVYLDAGPGEGLQHDGPDYYDVLRPDGNG